MNVVRLFKEPEPQPTKVVLHDGQLVMTARVGIKGTTWQYQIRLPEENAYERKSTGKADYNQALKIAEDRLKEINWRYNRGLSNVTVSFDKASDALIDEIKTKNDLKGGRTTTAAHLNIAAIKELQAHFGMTPLTDITVGQIKEYHQLRMARWKLGAKGKIATTYHKSGSGKLLDQPKVVMRKGTWKRKPSLKSMAHQESLIRRTFEIAIEHGWITKDEMINIPRRELKFKRRGYFEPAELDTLLSVLKTRITDTTRSHHQKARKMLYVWVEFMLATSIRPGTEYRAIRSKDVVYHETVYNGKAVPHTRVIITTGKTGSRTVVAPPEIRKLIDDMNPNIQPDDIIFGRGMNAQFKEVLKELGMEFDVSGNSRSAYSLRHTSITGALLRGRDPNALAKNSGTSLHQISHTYDHLVTTAQIEELLK
jgi:hypothetical protein